MVWVRSPVYFYKRKDTFYFSRAVPSDLRQRFNKRKIEVSLRTKSQVKAARSAAALSDRLERYWDSLRMEMVYSRELGLRAAPEVKAAAVHCLSLLTTSLSKKSSPLILSSMVKKAKSKLRSAWRLGTLNRGRSADIGRMNY